MKDEDEKTLDITPLYIILNCIDGMPWAYYQAARLLINLGVDVCNMTCDNAEFLAVVTYEAYRQEYEAEDA